jgi:opacity protein-like surface antigen
MRILGARVPVLESRGREIFKAQGKKAKNMSAKHRNLLNLIAVAAAALALGVAAPAVAQKRSADRAGTAEFGLQLMDFSGVHVDGLHGAALDVEGDLAWGFVGGYNFNDHFMLGGEMSWASPSYRATFAPNPGPLQGINANLDLGTFILKGTFNFFNGPLTPYAEVGAGWVHVDSNIVNGQPSTGCWWDPWWGYVCTTFYDTYSDTRTAWTYALGVRWDVSDSIALRASYGYLDLDTSHATKDVSLDTWRAELVWKF